MNRRRNPWQPREKRSAPAVDGRKAELLLTMILDLVLTAAVWGCYLSIVDVYARADLRPSVERSACFGTEYNAAI